MRWGRVLGGSPHPGANAIIGPGIEVMEGPEQLTLHVPEFCWDFILLDETDSPGLVLIDASPLEIAAAFVIHSHTPMARHIRSTYVYSWDRASPRPVAAQPPLAACMDYLRWVADHREPTYMDLLTQETNGQDDTAWRQHADSLSCLAAYRGLQALSGTRIATTGTCAAAC